MKGGAFFALYGCNHRQAARCKMGNARDYPVATASSATVNIRTEVTNENIGAANCALQSVILDSTGTTVGTASSSASVARMGRMFSTRA